MISINLDTSECYTFFPCTAHSCDLGDGNISGHSVCHKSEIKQLCFLTLCESSSTHEIIRLESSVESLWNDKSKLDLESVFSINEGSRCPLMVMTIGFAQVYCCDALNSFSGRWLFDGSHALCMVSVIPCCIVVFGRVPT